MIRQHKVVTPHNVGASHVCSTELEGDLVRFDTGPAIEGGWQVVSAEVDLSRLKHLFATLRGARIYPGHRDTFDGSDEVVRFYVSKLKLRSAQIASFPQGSRFGKLPGPFSVIS